MLIKCCTHKTIKCIQEITKTGHVLILLSISKPINKIQMKCHRKESQLNYMKRIFELTSIN
jgi:hypothetical protein